MKKYWIIIVLLISINLLGFTQEVKAVFDVTSADIKIHESTMRHVMMMSSSYPDSEFEIVVYSGALAMMLNDKSTVKSEIESVLKNGNVTINVCAMSLKRLELDHTALINGVGTVPDGILEIIDKQSKGWGYIKEAN